MLLITLHVRGFVLCIGVLGILVTAPLGAMGISLSGPKLLQYREQDDKLLQAKQVLISLTSASYV